MEITKYLAFVKFMTVPCIIVVPTGIYTHVPICITNLELIDPNLLMKSENSCNNNHVMLNYLNQLLMHPPSWKDACNEYLKIFIYSRLFCA